MINRQWIINSIIETLKEYWLNKKEEQSWIETLNNLDNRQLDRLDLTLWQKKRQDNIWKDSHD